MKNKLKELINQQKGLLDKAKAEGRIFTDEERTQWNNLQKEIEAVKAQIVSEEQFQNSQDFINQPASTPNTFTPKDKGKKLFKDVGEQLKAIMIAGLPSGSVDPRLLEINNAASGSSTGTGEDGAYLIQTDFVPDMMQSAYKESGLLSLCDTKPVGPNSNGVTWNDLQENDISASIYGGLITYWANEAGTVESSKPKFNRRKVELEKLMGIYYATDEMLEDAAFMGSMVSDGMRLSIRRSLENAVLNGDGKGHPLGINNSPALITIAKETNQAADTLVYENLQKMEERMVEGGKNWAYIAHPDAKLQIMNMVHPASTSNHKIPLYDVNGMLANGMKIPTLNGYPLIFTDLCSALGDAGDIILADLYDYLIIQKGGIKEDSTIAVRFLYGEKTFRWTLRVNGAPKTNSALTIKNSTKTRSHYLRVAARA